VTFVRCLSVMKVCSMTIVRTAGQLMALTACPLIELALLGSNLSSSPAKCVYGATVLHRAGAGAAGLRTSRGPTVDGAGLGSQRTGDRRKRTAQSWVSASLGECVDLTKS
jgi:hypothetical protein